MASSDDAGLDEGRQKGERREEIPPCPECGATNWAVIYELTLGVGVREGGIECVVVEDENLGPIRRVACRACDFTFHEEEARRHPAAQLAEEAEDWPHWQFGW